jgi:hypothetical protein
MILARTVLTWAGAVALLLSPAMPAAGQTAGDINRLNQAVQVCNSPMGAGMPECAKLRGQLGGGGGLGGGGLGGGKGAAAAGILGALNSAMSARQAPATMAPTASAANSQAIAACVRNAAGNAAMIQACLSAAPAPRAPTLGAPSGVPSLGQPLLPSAQRNYDTASAIHQGGQSYQACAAANPGNWQSCLPLLNGGQPR